MGGTQIASYNPRNNPPSGQEFETHFMDEETTGGSRSDHGAEPTGPVGLQPALRSLITGRDHERVAYHVPGTLLGIHLRFLLYIHLLSLRSSRGASCGAPLGACRQGQERVEKQRWRGDT